MKIVETDQETETLSQAFWRRIEGIFEGKVTPATALIKPLLEVPKGHKILGTIEEDTKAQEFYSLSHELERRLRSLPQPTTASEKTIIQLASGDLREQMTITKGLLWQRILTVTPDIERKARAIGIGGKWKIFACKIPKMTLELQFVGPMNTSEFAQYLAQIGVPEYKKRRF